MLKYFCKHFYYQLPDQSILSWTIFFNWITKPTQFQLSLLCYTPNSMLKHTIVHNIIEQSNPSAPSLNAIMRQTFTKGFSTQGTTLKIYCVSPHQPVHSWSQYIFAPLCGKIYWSRDWLWSLSFLSSLDRKGVKITIRDGGSPIHPINCRNTA